MSLVPFYMLDGEIDLIKEIVIDENTRERTYMDENGNISIIIRSG